MRTRFKRGGLVAAFVLVASVALTACGHTAKAYSSQCIYLLQNGWGDAHHVRAIVYPGQKANATGDTRKYIYCNARNYLVGQKGDDEETPITVRTKPSTAGDQGSAVNVNLSVYWQLNQDKQTLLDFLPFCEKYNCFATSSSISDSGTHSSSAGWNAMLAENFPRALQRAAVTAAQDFASSLPNEQGQWNKFGDEVSANFMKEIAIADGSGSADYFCGSGSKDGKCDPVVVQINDVSYANSQAQDLANQSANLAQQDQIVKQQAQVNADTLAAAKQKYGDSAGTVLGDLDIINACKNAGSTCVITLGSGSSANVTVPAK